MSDARSTPRARAGKRRRAKPAAHTKKPIPRPGRLLGQDHDAVYPVVSFYFAEARMQYRCRKEGKDGSAVGTDRKGLPAGLGLDWPNYVRSFSRPSGTDQVRLATTGAPFFLINTFEIARAMINTVSTASSRTKCCAAVSVLSRSSPNSAVKTSTRRMAEMSPTRRNGSGPSACSRKETWTV